MSEYLSKMFVSDKDTHKILLYILNKHEIFPHLKKSMSAGCPNHFAFNHRPPERQKDQQEPPPLRRPVKCGLFWRI